MQKKETSWGRCTEGNRASVTLAIQDCFPHPRDWEVWLQTSEKSGEDQGKKKKLKYNLHLASTLLFPFQY